MNKTKFALAGGGRIGKRHAEHISNLGTLVAVCDTDPIQLAYFKENYGCPTYDSIDKLLDSHLDFDVLTICTPNGLHAEHTIKGLRAGYHVLCEKPMALSVYDCGEMIKEAEKANKRLFIVKQNRFNPPIEALKKAIDENRLGKILSVQLACFWNRNDNYYENSWKGTLALDGGTLYTQFSHFVDLFYWLVGDVRKIQAFTKNLNHTNTIEFEDSGVVIIEFYNGTLGTINYSVNATNKNMEGSITVIGDKGTVKVGGQYLNELEYQQFSDGFRIENLPEGKPANNYGNYQGSMSNHDKVYENIISVLNNQGVIATNGFEGLKTVEIIHKIYESSGRE